MYKFFISILLVGLSLSSFGQSQPKDSVTIAADSIVYKSPYGLRVGVDLSKPILGVIDNKYNGLEFVADYRISKKFFIATEFGYEERTSIEGFTNSGLGATNSTSKGSYIRLGANYNAYKNWLDMNNEIFVGLRYGFSIFEQTLNSYTQNNNTGEVNIPPYFDPATSTTPMTETGLNAHWSEIVVGFRAETLNNLFLSASFSYKILINVKDQEGFKTLYAPGFNRIFESGTGFGFNYSISYLIPFKKK